MFYKIDNNKQEKPDYANCKQRFILVKEKDIGQEADTCNSGDQVQNETWYWFHLWEFIFACLGKELK